MNNRILLAGLAFGFAAITTTVMANEPYLPRGQKVFTKLDTDKNGKIVLAEISPVVTKRFMKYDGNGDSAISAAEIDKALMVALEKRRARMMTNMDADSNGAISKPELDKYISAMLNGADTDQDGGVSFAEVSAFKIAKWRKSRLEPTAN